MGAISVPTTVFKFEVLPTIRLPLESIRIASPPLILAINGAVAAAEFAEIAPVTARPPPRVAAPVAVSVLKIELVN